MEVVESLISKLKNPELKSFNLKPWFLGFKGVVVKKQSSSSSSEEKESYTTKGLYERCDINKILVTELPIGNWT